MAGHAVYTTFLNPTETGLGIAALASSLLADQLSNPPHFEGGSIAIGVSEDTATSLVTAAAGYGATWAVLDAPIDAYASAASHSRAPGVMTLLSKVGVHLSRFDIGPFSLRFGR